jgi:hypothetical protein
VASITLPRSPARLSSGDEVPHIFTTKVACTAKRNFDHEGKKTFATKSAHKRPAYLGRVGPLRGHWLDCRDRPLRTSRGHPPARSRARAIGDRKFGRHRKATPMRSRLSLLPGWRALARAVDEADEFLFALRRRVARRRRRWQMPLCTSAPAPPAAAA